ncbi:MAG: AMP-binding protein, partial [Alphaproteobacteria bacterium]
TLLSFKDIINKNPEKDYDTYSLKLSGEETKQLRKFAQDQQLTLNTVIQGAVGLVLKTYTQQSEVIIGVTVSGRTINLPGVEDMVGLFINTLPLRISPQPEETILAFLHRLQEQAQILNDYCYTPLAQIQSWAGVNRSLFDVIFVFENYPVEEETLSRQSDFMARGLKGIEKTEYPLTIIIEPAKHLHISLSYQTEHFNEELIKRLSDHIKVLLKDILKKKEANSTLLSLLTTPEKQQILIEWNDTKVEYPQDKTVHQLFEEQVEKTPDNIAVVYEEQELTYQQLNQKANQLAHYLRTLGVGSGELVGIYIDSSPYMIVALLAVLKAGSAYIPVDTLHPNDRLNYMFLKAGVRLVLTSKELSKNLSSDLQCLYLEKDFSTYPLLNLIPSNTSQDLIYVLYTSGSTGWPKGALLRHRGIVNLLHFYTQKFDMVHQDKVLIISSFSFDLTQKNILGMLLVGGTVCLRSTSKHDAFNIAKTIAHHKITLLNCTPSGFYPLLEGDFPLTLLSSLKQVFLGGEPIITHRLQPIVTHDLSMRITNTYGPTECSDLCATYRLTVEDIIEGKMVPVGKVLPNISIYILSPALKLVPTGCVGELYIGGVGVGEGYLNRPDLTAEKFVPNPF